jgi:hypothetical protein
MSLDDTTPEQVEQCNATGRTPVVFIQMRPAGFEPATRGLEVRRSVH